MILKLFILRALILKMKNLIKRNGISKEILLFVVSAIIILCLIENHSIAHASLVKNKLDSLYIEILENGVDVFEPLFTEKHTKAPDSGFYDFREYKNWTHPRNEAYYSLCMIPGNGQVVLTYAVLLKYTDKKHFGRTRCPRETLFNHARKAIRWICLTSIYVENPYPFLKEARSDLVIDEHWHRKYGLRQDLIGYLSIGVALLWNDLDAETKNLFKSVAIGGALRGRIVRSADMVGNGNHDQVKQDLSSTMAAAFLFPDHPGHSRFMEAVECAGIDLVSTTRDFSSDLPVGEHRLKDLAAGWNLNPDYSSFHHNHPSLWYGIEKIFEGRLFVEVLSQLTKIPVPETYTYKGNGFDGVFRYASILTTRDGVMMHLRSPEYDCCYGEGLLAFCYGSILKKEPYSLWLEKKAAEIMLHHTKSIGQFDYHRCSWAKASLSFLMHQFYPVDKTNQIYKDDEKFFNNIDGCHSFKSLNAIVHRNFKTWTGFIWGTNGEAGGGGPGAYVVPNQAGGPLIYNTSDGLVGSLLIHRPIWLYFGLVFFALVFMFFSFLSAKRKYQSISEIFIFFSFIVFFIFLFIGWVDLNYTVLVRIPSAEIPSWVFSALGVVAGAIAIMLFFSERSFHKYKYLEPIILGRLFLLSLFVIPVSIFLMIRTPWVDILKNQYILDSPLFYILGVCICLIGISCKNIKMRLRRFFVVFLWAFLFLALGSLIGGICIGADARFYLRLVSIRNLSRIYLAAGMGVLFLGLAVLCNLVLERKNQKLIFFEISAIFFAASLSVSILSFGRFDLPLVSKIQYKASDDGFFTAGEFYTSSAKQKVAFLSFESGLSILFLDLIGSKDAIISYSGLKIPFYHRNGFVPERKLSYKDGEKTIQKLGKVNSNWWAVDGLLGMVFYGGNPLVFGGRQLGNNWARTEEYIDRMDVVLASPLRVVKMRDGESLIKLMAGIYTGIDTSEIERFSNEWKILSSPSENNGWMGALAPAVNDGLSLAIANIEEKPVKSELSVNWQGWSPVFAMPGKIINNKLIFEIDLEYLGIVKDQSNLLVRCDGNCQIDAVRIGKGRYKLDLGKEARSVIKLRWIGPSIKQAVQQSNFEQIYLDTEELCSENGSEATIDGEAIITFLSDHFNDFTPPFVEVDKPFIMANGNFEVQVESMDQSGIENISFYKDGIQVGEKKSAPYVWQVAATNKFHSFSALATDNSEQKNKRFSNVTSWAPKNNELSSN